MRPGRLRPRRVLLDLDHFKAFNDTPATPPGTGCSSAPPRAGVRSSPARAPSWPGWGGEEFLVVLAGVDRPAVDALLNGCATSSPRAARSRPVRPPGPRCRRGRRGSRRHRRRGPLRRQAAGRDRTCWAPDAAAAPSRRTPRPRPRRARGPTRPCAVRRNCATALKPGSARPIAHRGLVAAERAGLRSPWRAYALLGGLVALTVQVVPQDPSTTACSSSRAAEQVSPRPSAPGCTAPSGSAWWLLAAGLGAWALGDVAYWLCWWVLDLAGSPGPRTSLRPGLPPPRRRAAAAGAAGPSRPRRRGHHRRGHPRRRLRVAVVDVPRGARRWPASVPTPSGPRCPSPTARRVVVVLGPSCGLRRRRPPVPAFRLLAAAAVVMLVPTPSTSTRRRSGPTTAPASTGCGRRPTSGGGAPPCTPRCGACPTGPHQGAAEFSTGGCSCSRGQLLAPATLALQLLLGLPPQGWAVVVGSTVLFLLVVLRMHALLRRVRAQAALLADLARTAPHGLAEPPQRRRELRACATGPSSTARPRRRPPRPRPVQAVQRHHGHPAGDRLLVGASTRGGWRSRARAWRWPAGAGRSSPSSRRGHPAGWSGCWPTCVPSSRGAVLLGGDWRLGRAPNRWTRSSPAPTPRCTPPSTRGGPAPGRPTAARVGAPPRPDVCEAARNQRRRRPQEYRCTASPASSAGTPTAPVPTTSRSASTTTPSRGAPRRRHRARGGPAARRGCPAGRPGGPHRPQRPALPGALPRHPARRGRSSCR